MQYLLSRKFPDHPQLRLPSSLSGGSPSLEERQERLKEINEYEARLRAMPPADLLLLRDREQAQERLEVQRDDAQRFFYQPQAAADFAHWSKAAHWTLDEAVALSFGKAPEVVNWQSVRPFVAVSPFAASCQRSRDLALRARQWQQLFDPVLPGFFLAWAKRNDIDIPQALEEFVRARGQQVADWKSLYDDLSARFEEERVAAARALADKDGEIAGLVRDRDAQREQVA